ncbi:MAG: AAA family ATPase [Peptococcaceae bacterium]|nr:AAA family ATPase [Peptococcaceae bacterium]
MKEYLQEFEQEKKRLDTTVTLVRLQMDAAQQALETKEAGILAAKEDMPDDTAHAVAGLYSAHNFEDLVELSQYAYLVSGQVAEHESEGQKIRQFRSMALTPYFSRIDFTFEDTQECESIYIGRFSLRDDASREIVVYDWRSPIASVFYRFGTGKAFYDAPGGTIAGEVSLKRQFEIHQGVLDYFFDADVQIVDEFLRKLLSQNAAPQMKTIVETIQKDQDIIIRDSEHDLVMVQGVAGSGKTSIGLHRAAYLMYQAMSGLASNQIVILSPNKLFERYISNVLPELGEKNVQTLVFEEVFQRLINRRVQSRTSLLEHLIASRDPSAKAVVKSVLEFKMSETFMEILHRFVYDIPRRWIPFADAEYAGRLVMPRRLIQAKVLQQEHSFPLAVRLKKAHMFICHHVRKRRPHRLETLRRYVIAGKRHPFDAKTFARMVSIRESTAMIRRVKAYTEIDVLALYVRLFQDDRAFYRLAKGLPLPPDMDRILAYTRETLGAVCGLCNLTDEPGPKAGIPYADAAALAYLELIISGRRDFADIRQVVVDEAQDYYPLHYAILRVLFPKACYTILGDIHQSMEKEADTALYTTIPRVLDKDNPVLMTLDKSFRSTREIIGFSAQFLGEGVRITSFSRSGEAPMVHKALDSDALHDQMAAEIRSCLDSQYRSVGVLCKTERDAVEIYQHLHHRIPMRLICTDVAEALEGVSVMPLSMAKGLEFDAVLVCHVDNIRYTSEDDRRLLYIACTRALHRLSLFYAGEESPLV